MMPMRKNVSCLISLDWSVFLWLDLDWLMGQNSEQIIEIRFHSCNFSLDKEKWFGIPSGQNQTVPNQITEVFAIEVGWNLRLDRINNLLFRGGDLDKFWGIFWMCLSSLLVFFSSSSFSQFSASKRRNRGPDGEKREKEKDKRQFWRRRETFLFILKI